MIPRTRVERLRRQGKHSAEQRCHTLAPDAYDRHLGDEAPVDRASGPRNVTQVPPEDLVAASRMLGTLTAFLLKAREAEEADGPGVITAMEAAHERLVRLIERLKTRA